MAKLRAILLKNGYPVHLVDWLIKNTVERKQIEPGEEEARYVSIWLPWIANRSTEFCRSIKQAVQKAFTRTVPRVIFTTSPAFSGRAKDVLPIMAKSCIVYEFKCRCKQAYIGKTTQRLSERVNQHILVNLLQSTAKACLRKVPAKSAITKHLKDNPSCISERLLQQLQIVTHAWHKFHFNVLEALYIKKHTPVLCQQKEHARALSLFS